MKRLKPFFYDSNFFKFNLFCLILFVIFEVFLFGKNNIPQTIVAFLEYSILTIIAFINIRVAIAYFVSFSLLSFGAWSYIVDDSLPGNFWGLRLFGVSANLIFSILLLIILISKTRVFKRNFFPIEIYFIFLFYIISFFLGIIYSNIKINYFDNYLHDLMIYSPVFIFSFLVFSIDEDLSLKIFRCCIIATLTAMLFSLLFGIFFEYGNGLKFILLNSFGYIIIFIILFSKRQFPPYQYYFLLLIASILLISGKYFVGGKFIIILLFTVFWYLIIYKRQIVFSTLSFFLLTLVYIYWNSISQFLILFFEDNLLVQYKLSQVISLIEIFDLELLSMTPTSMGNIVGEAVTIFNYFLLHPFISLTGLGFGGGVPDLYGYLAPLAKPGMAYAEINAARDNFFRMHLPLFEFFLKSGLLGGIIFFYLSIKNFKNNNIFSFFFFLIFFTVFSNNKEMIMLAFFFLRLSIIKKVSTNQMVVSSC